MKEETIKKLLTFFQALDMVSSGNAPDLGMIVIEPKINPEEIAKMAPEKSVCLTLDKNSLPDDILSEIQKAFEEKKWIFIELKDGYLPGRIYNQLRNLSINGKMQVFNFSGKDEVEIHQPPQSRIVLLATKKAIDAVEAPTFLNLFGPIIYL